MAFFLRYLVAIFTILVVICHLTHVEAGRCKKRRLDLLEDELVDRVYNAVDKLDRNSERGVGSKKRSQRPKPDPDPDILDSLDYLDYSEREDKLVDRVYETVDELDRDLERGAGGRTRSPKPPAPKPPGPKPPGPKPPGPKPPGPKPPKPPIPTPDPDIPDPPEPEPEPEPPFPPGPDPPNPPGPSDQCEKYRCSNYDDFMSEMRCYECRNSKGYSFKATVVLKEQCLSKAKCHCETEGWLIPDAKLKSTNGEGDDDDSGRKERKGRLIPCDQGPCRPGSCGYKRKSSRRGIFY